MRRCSSTNTFEDLLIIFSTKDLIRRNKCNASLVRFDGHFLRSHDMQERRNKSRHKILKAGTIVFNRAGTISCTVRNLSQAGACLQVESPVGIPEAFDLRIDSEGLIITHHCKVEWRTVHQIGVAFT